MSKGLRKKVVSLREQHSRCVKLRMELKKIQRNITRDIRKIERRLNIKVLK